MLGMTYAMLSLAVDATKTKGDDETDQCAARRRPERNPLQRQPLRVGRKFFRIHPIGVRWFVKDATHLSAFVRLELLSKRQRRARPGYSNGKKTRL
jgi:hypothetical protein